MYVGVVFLCAVYFCACVLQACNGYCTTLQVLSTATMRVDVAFSWIVSQSGWRGLGRLDVTPKIRHYESRYEIHILSTSL